ncbi:MAG: thiamine-phosphate kinase, partial [Acidobacteria bacterium]|nr:thiamine-phosphate kinase [Acidobacteriota bacterium]
WLTRSGAYPGDELWLSGTIGGARAALEMLTTGDTPDAACVTRLCRPEPRVRLGIAMARNGVARAAMDTSDGLGDAVRQLAAASGCGARVDAAAVPVEAGAAAWWLARGVDHVEAAVRGGEDYELLFAVPPRFGGRLRNVRRQVATPALTRIGVLTREPECWLLRDGARTPWPEGFEHFGGGHERP